VEVGVLPSENSLVGPVADLTRLLAVHALSPIAEAAIPIRQCLIAPRPSALSEVGEVRSHPVALRQCRRFLEAHPWMRPVATNDTAGAVREIVAAGRTDLAAIAGAAAADVYSACILARDIADRADNTTRFVLFERRSRR
jgi:prephenate dehydratase